MSLDARFTQLRRSMERSRTGPAGSFQRNPPPRERVSSLKNRLLAIEMAERPNVMAALSRGRSRARRGSFTGGVGLMTGGAIPAMGRARSPFPRSRSRQRSGSIRRSNSLGRLGRSQSLQSLMSIGSEPAFNFVGGRRGGRPGRGGFRTRVFTRGSRITARGGVQKLNMDLVASARRKRSAPLSRLSNSIAGGGGFKRGRGGRGASTSSIKSRLGVRTTSSLSRSASLTNLSSFRGGVRGGLKRSSSVQRGTRGARGNIRQRGLNRQNMTNINTRGKGQIGIRSSTRGNRGGRQQSGRGAATTSNRGGFRGRRGGMRGRGGRGGRGNATKKPVMPSKEELDMELDKYMSNTRSYLDKQLDQYMAQPTATA